MIVGEEDETSSNTLLVTKSVKDTKCAMILGANSRGMLNEGVIPSPVQMNYFKKKGKRVVFLYDNDEKGMETVKRICDVYNQEEVGYIFLPKHVGKDVWDFTYNEGKEAATQWLDENNLLT